MYGRSVAFNIGWGSPGWHSSKKTKVRTIKYANDTGVTAQSEEQCHSMLERIYAKGKEYEITANSKVEFKWERKSQYTDKREKSRHVNSFRYLGSIITENGNCNEVFKLRIGFGKVKSLLTAKRIDFSLRNRSVKWYACSVVLYGSQKEKKYLLLWKKRTCGR